ncbi:hypothetical protein AAVH_20347 [Aphelenchoides avenae]|nr:hypothetical protein AAVH_20347 [Aphelenchus avenae]
MSQPSNAVSSLKGPFDFRCKGLLRDARCINLCGAQSEAVAAGRRFTEVVEKYCGPNGNPAATDAFFDDAHAFAQVFTSRIRQSCPPSTSGFLGVVCGFLHCQVNAVVDGVKGGHTDDAVALVADGFKIHQASAVALLREELSKSCNAVNRPYY